MAASARLFQQHGYHNVSMDDIAAAVGITGPALYRHFSNKHEVLVQALSAQLMAIEALLTRLLAEETDGETRFEALLAGLATEVVLVHEVLLWKRERVHLDADEGKAFLRRVRKVHGQIVEIIRGWRPDISENDAQLFSWVLQSIYSNTQEYRSAMDGTQLARLLSQMTHAAMSVDLSAAAPEHPCVPPGFGPTPVGRRERVLDTAAQLFYDRGYRAVSVEDIAEASQTAIATVYQLVPSKASLLSAILQRGSEGIIYLTAHRRAFAPKDESALNIIVDTWLEAACGPHARVLKILATDSLFLEEEDQRALRRSSREYVEEWVHALIAVQPAISPVEARARVHTAIGVISETVLITNMRKRPNLHGEMWLLAIAMLGL
jgi:AcrR family transcriptional regulator